MAPPRRLLTERTPSHVLPLGYHAFVPDGEALLPPLVIVHGSSRGAGRHFRAFLPTALLLNVPLIVPTFGDDRFHGYQWLAGTDGPMLAQEALALTLADASAVLGLDTSAVDLLGFSGGAQFVQRHALTAPQGVRRVVVAAAGWYTFLDPTRPFPHGCGGSPASRNRGFRVEAFIGLPVHVLIGERDVLREPSLRTGPSIDRRQGLNRLARGLRWVDHVEEVARMLGLPSRITFDLLPGCGHSFSDAVRHGGLVERSFDFLHGNGAASVGVEGTRR